MFPNPAIRCWLSRNDLSGAVDLAIKSHKTGRSSSSKASGPSLATSGKAPISRLMATQPKRRGSTKRNSWSPASDHTTWVCTARGSLAACSRSRPVIPRCTRMPAAGQCEEPSFVRIDAIKIGMLGTASTFAPTDNLASAA